MPAPPPVEPGRVGTAVRAVRHKLRLLTAYGNLWPAAARGVRLLAAGRVGEFRRKLLREGPDAPEVVPPGTGRDLFLAGYVLGPGGYDHVVLAVLRGLAAAGVTLLRDPRAIFGRDVVPPDLQPLRARRTGQPRLAVVPPHLLYRFRPDARTAALTMWETDALPAAAVRQLNRCGLVVVPSRWGAECFRANGVAVPIEVVPLGHDPDLFRPAGPPPAGRCVFGTAGALDQGGLRKNVQRVVDVFRAAFPAEPGVRLRVKITPASPPVDTHGDRRIDVIRAALSPAELAAWYRSLTAFVNGSFGEGFGLHLLEAMACGRPLISTTFGGVGAFFDGAVGYEVGYRLVEARNAVYRGRWADPDVTDLVRQLWQVAADPADARRRGAAAAARAAAFTWADTARGLAGALERHGFLASG